MMTQVSFFANGGGSVVHRITGSFSGRASGWFDAADVMIECEQIVSRASGNGVVLSSRPVKRDGPMWAEIERAGKVAIERERAAMLVAAASKLPTRSLGPCWCQPGRARDNCPQCEGTGRRIDFAAIRAGKV